MDRIEAFSEGLQVSMDKDSLIQSDWMEKIFKHPRKDKTPWSFKDHEWMIDIVNDNARDIDLIKSAQIGASTVQVLATAAFCTQHDFVKGAYVLPTAAFATEFTSTRINPMLERSPYIKKRLSPDLDNASVKQIGNSFFYIRGTTGTASISVDLDYIAQDEIDFCDAVILSQYTSRLQHSDWKLIRKFSTPTHPDMGIDQEYQEGSQAVRMVKCSGCETWVYPDVFNDIVIPRWDEAFTDFGKSEVRSGSYDLDGAYIKCSSCGKNLWESLTIPDRREWVHKYPDREKHGYAASFFDVPRYNPVSEVLGSISRYAAYSDWVNFRLGKSFSNADASFLMEVVDRQTVVTPIPPENASPLGNTFMGLDLGKTSWLTIGRAGQKGLEIIWLEQITAEGSVGLGGVAGVVLERCRQYGVHRIVSDALPQFEVSMELVSKLPLGSAFGAYYIGETKGSLDIYVFNDVKGIVNIDRTKHFNGLSKSANAGSIWYPRMPGQEMEVVKKHMKALKRVKVPFGAGYREVWTCGERDDHYAHSIGYLYTAYASVKERFIRTGASVNCNVITVPMRD